jgi:hypothetical protein
MATRSEILAEAAAIRRYAMVAGIMRRALDPAPILETSCQRQEVLNLKVASKFRRPRPLFIIPPRYARIMRACAVIRAR